jgi:hypothetical protein
MEEVEHPASEEGGSRHRSRAREKRDSNLPMPDLSDDRHTLFDSRA